MKIQDFIEGYMDVLPVGIVICQPELERNLIKAIRFYCGYSALKSVELDETMHSAIGKNVSIENCNNLDLDLSELAIIRPLFDLYVELENATSLEASRGQGLDVYGRATSEVQADIRDMEADFSRKCFSEPPFTI